MITNISAVETQITLLMRSIAHWKRITKSLDAVGAEHCSLCQEYSMDCFGCPVEEVTGRGYCKRTPYRAVEDYVCDQVGDWFIPKRDKQGVKLALRELKFLESVLAKMVKKFYKLMMGGGQNV